MYDVVRIVFAQTGGSCGAQQGGEVGARDPIERDRVTPVNAGDDFRKLGCRRHRDNLLRSACNVRARSRNTSWTDLGRAAAATGNSHVEVFMLQRARAGAIAGIAGGIVFGMLMGMMGMLTVIASMVGSSSAVVGFMVHLMMSAMIGAGFGVVLGTLATTTARSISAGAAYGVAGARSTIS